MGGIKRDVPLSTEKGGKRIEKEKKRRGGSNEKAIISPSLPLPFTAAKNREKRKR